MYLGNEPNVRDEDISRYFNHCYVRDPISGLPGKIRAIDRNTVIIDVYKASSKDSVDRRTYKGEQVRPFHTVDTYDVPELGWRDPSDNGRMMLFLRQHQQGGIRGLNADRLRRASIWELPWRGLTPRDLGDVYADDAYICTSLFNPINRTLAEAVNIIQESKFSRSVVVNNHCAIHPLNEREGYALLIYGTVAGVGFGNELVLQSPALTYFLGGLNGIQVK